jgi:hypothetical protein
MDMDKAIYFWLQGFGDLKSKFLLNVKLNISSSMRKEDFQLIYLTIPVSFRWMVPLSV